jgi:hypothetical protein
MGMQQEFLFESGFLKVVASGEFSLDEAQQAFLEMLAAVIQYHADKILFDGRTVKGKPKVMERFYYGSFAATETRKIVNQYRFEPKFAYVLHEPLRDPERFGETVALNRGMRCKVFENLEYAFEWLDSSH